MGTMHGRRVGTVQYAFELDRLPVQSGSFRGQASGPNRPEVPVRYAIASWKLAFGKVAARHHVSVVLLSVALADMFDLPVHRAASRSRLRKGWIPEEFRPQENDLRPIVCRQPP
jgi:hypothetical protein